MLKSDKDIGQDKDQLFKIVLVKHYAVLADIQ